MLHDPRISAGLKNWAHDAGFDLAGVAAPEKSRFAAEYRRWLDEGQHGAMDYLARNASRRNDLPAAFPWVKSVISVAMAYYQQMPQCVVAPPAGKIARYAWGRDYHRVLLSALKVLEKRLRTELKDAAPHGFMARAYVDTGPIDERDLAARAGLGWIGKHTLLINPTHGSWFVLGELLTSLPLEPDRPMPDRCGVCTRCIDACPTGAITPYHVNATRCISYQTLENRGPVPEELHAGMAQAGYLAGCDICQDVCPWNRRPLATSQRDFVAVSPAPAIALREIINLSDPQWDQLTRGKAHRRAKPAMWRRTAEILLGRHPTVAPAAAPSGSDSFIAPP